MRSASMSELTVIQCAPSPVTRGAVDDDDDAAADDDATADDDDDDDDDDDATTVKGGSATCISSVMNLTQDRNIDSVSSP